MKYERMHVCMTLLYIRSTECLANKINNHIYPTLGFVFNRRETNKVVSKIKFDTNSRGLSNLSM